MEDYRINILSDFGRLLGARYKYEGSKSGEEFLEDILEEKFLLAKNNNRKLIIELDGVRGYPSSFVSGSFGKLSIEHGSDVVLKTIEFVSTNNIRKEKIISEIKNPKKKNEDN